MFAMEPGAFLENILSLACDFLFQEGGLLAMGGGFFGEPVFFSLSLSHRDGGGCNGSGNHGNDGGRGGSHGGAVCMCVEEGGESFG